MESANFIPLGDVNRRTTFDNPEKPKRVIGKTKEERKQIAREIRLAAKREKKKFKADAKRQRKQNSVIHRRLTRNNEKYSKNTDRNKQRSIDLERNKIRYNAVKQAECMAAKYDMSGKTFNVGEVIILEDGKIKSKAVLQRAEEEKARKDAEAKAANGVGELIEGINRERQANIQGLPVEKKKHVSKKQQKKLEMLVPKPTPPKPVIPEGYSLPEGEENLIDLWDITDEDILKRLSNHKREKTTAAKHLRRAQKEKKKLNRAMKALKKEAGNKKLLWDPEAARKEILGEAKYLLKDSGDEKDEAESDSDSSSDSDEDEDAEIEWESDDEVKARKDKKRTKTSTFENFGTDDTGVVAVTKNFPNRPKINLTLLKAAEDKERELAEKKKIAREKRKVEAKILAQKTEADAKKKAEDEAASGVPDIEMTDEVEPEKNESKKRKRSKDDEEATEGEKKKKSKKEKGHKKGREESQTSGTERVFVETNDPKLDAMIAEEQIANSHTVAEQWNPDALTGDDARKDKFLRLLGANKGGVSGREKKSRKSKKESRQIEDMRNAEAELERQFEMGVKMKHDGGKKRRGLGA